MNLIILAMNKKECSRLQSRCKFCGEHNKWGHMERNHRDELNRLYALRRDMAAGWQDNVEYRPKWHLLGKKI